MDDATVTLIYHRSCSECQLVREALDKHNVHYRTRDVYDAPLTREELSVLLDGVDVKAFLNPRATEYRDRGMAEHPPSADLAVELLSRDPRLLRCPILVRGDETFAVNIETDAAVMPPEMWKFLGIEVAVKKPVSKSGAAAHKAAPKPAEPPKA